MTEELSTPEVAEPLKARIVELFGEVCAKPDDDAVARAADRTLRDLDEALRRRRLSECRRGESVN
jgi:hypothetical protein